MACQNEKGKASRARGPVTEVRWLGGLSTMAHSNSSAVVPALSAEVLESQALRMETNEHHTDPRLAVRNQL